VVRSAEPDDVEAITRFGEVVIRPHYAPLIGAAAADAQVRDWWNESHVREAVTNGLVVIAEAGGKVVGVAQRGQQGSDHVIYKLYVHPEHRRRGFGPQLIAALIQQLPPDAGRLHIEHFAGNEHAGTFYEREGFMVERVDPSATGNAALDVVWRVRDVSPSQ
jgi:ribosomal protein S18 acetylase RimI-like enzyme